MNRTDRLHSILLELQAQPWQRAADLADRLDVSTRTIYRDLRVLDGVGVPLHGVPGKGYRLDDGYVLPPVALTTDEAVLLLAGADHLARHGATRNRTVARAASAKLEAVLPDEVCDELDRQRAHVQFVPVNVFDAPDLHDQLRRLHAAIDEARPVRFREGAGGSVRTFDPYGLQRPDGGWRLVGRCHARGDVRHVPLKDVRDLETLDGAFERPAAYRAPAEPPPPDVVVRVRFDAAVSPWVRQAPPAFVEAAEATDDGGLCLTLHVRREAELLPWLLAWGAHADVLEPVTLRRRLRREALRLAARYDEPPGLLG